MNRSCFKAERSPTTANAEFALRTEGAGLSSEIARVVDHYSRRDELHCVISPSPFLGIADLEAYLEFYPLQISPQLV